jgi:uncharacterized repeat protein (TIGR01451 family)
MKNILMESSGSIRRGCLLAAMGCGLLLPAWAGLGPLSGTPSGPAGSLTGFAVSISSNGATAIVGAPGTSSNAGAASVLTRSGGTWSAPTLLTLGTGGSGAAQQGYSVAISGDGQTAMVGGPADATGGAAAGAVWFYALSGGTFTQQGPLQTGAAAGNLLGTSVALSSDGNTALAGAPGGNGVIVYVRSGSSWTVQTTFTASGTGTLGTSVALSADGNTALAGAPTSNSSAGGAWVFTRSSTTWSAGTQFPVATPAISAGRQGMSVSLSGDGKTAAVGGFSLSLAGAAWIYTLPNGGVWTQQALLTSDGSSAYGTSLALSGDGNNVLVGGSFYSGGAGVYVGYTRSVNPVTQVVTWAQQELTAGAAGWECGASVAISSDGNAGMVGCSGFSSSSGFVALVGAPDLTVANAHNGAFHRGDAADTYTLTVKNSGILATSGTVTLAVTPPAGQAQGILPAGLTLGSLSGTGWSCTGTTLTCTRGDALALGSSYAAVTLTVGVTSGAPAAIPLTVTVSGGGETNTVNDSATDLVLLPQIPDLTVSLSHSGSLYSGRTGVPYSVRVNNTGVGPTTGLVTMTNVIPAGLTGLTYSASQNGWSCSGSTTLVCTRSDVLAGGQSYPAVAYTVDVSSTPPSTISNTASVSGGGEGNTGNDTGTDTANVASSGPDLRLTTTYSGIFAVGVQESIWLTVTNIGAQNSHGTVTFVNTIPGSVTVSSISGNGWTCTLGSLTCTRTDSLPAGLSYHVITLKVTASAGAAPSFTNSATVSGGSESNTSNDSSSTVIPVH